MHRVVVVAVLGVLGWSACGETSGDACGGVCGPGLVCDQQKATCVLDSTAAGGGGGAAAGGGGGSQATGDGLPCDVANLLTARCTSCHGATLAGGAPFSIVTRADLLRMAPAGGTVAQRSLARLKDANAPMPPSFETPATAAEVAAFEAWVNAGTPAGSCTSGSGGGQGGGSAGGAGGGQGGGVGGGFAGGAGGGAGGGATGGGAGGGATGGGAGGGGGASTPYCRACTSSSSCGGSGNFCLGFSFGNYCGSDCSQGQACPTNARCANIVDSTNTVVGQNCVPVTGATCSGTGGGSGGGAGGGSGGGTGGGAGGGTGGGGGSSCTTDSWSGWPSSFFSTRCNSCHTHTGEFTSVSVVRSKLSSIKTRISYGNMPQGSTLPAADKTRIMTWLNCGAP